MLAVTAFAAVPGFAVNRVIKITAPTSVATGSKVSIPILVSTDAGGGEQIGFFHAEFSTDSGKTWTSFCYEEKVGAKAARTASFTAGGTGTRIMVRVRIAFRGGAAGDVDFKGSAIDWSNSWEKWSEPPARIASITVVGP